MADRIFDTLASTCPHLIAESIWLIIEGGSALDSCAFLRSRQTDSQGRAQYVAVPIDEKLIKYYEPCAEVLDILGEDVFE